VDLIGKFDVLGRRNSAQAKKMAPTKQGPSLGGNAPRVVGHAHV